MCVVCGLVEGLTLCGWAGGDAWGLEAAVGCPGPSGRKTSAELHPAKATLGDPATSWREKTQVRREGSDTAETRGDEDSADTVGATWEVAAWKRTERSAVANFKARWWKWWRKSQMDSKSRASKGEGVWQRENLVGCVGGEKELSWKEKWVSGREREREREPDRVFSSKATAKHVKSPTTTVG